jgi:hypothetical protein
VFIRIAAVVLTCTALCATARAELTAFWRHNPITPAAIVDDPALVGMQSWSVMVTLDGHWLYAGARLTLPSGSTFYRNANGGSHRPSAADIAAHPALAFHTYVTSPHTHIVFGHPTPTVLAGFPDPPISFGGAQDSVPGTFSILWGHLETVVYPTPPGTYEILRVTFPLGVLPVSHPANHTEMSLPTEVATIPSIPEPASALVVGIAALSFSWRRFRAP